MYGGKRNGKYLINYYHIFSLLYLNQIAGDINISHYNYSHKKRKLFNFHKISFNLIFIIFANINIYNKTVNILLLYYFIFWAIFQFFHYHFLLNKNMYNMNVLYVLLIFFFFKSLKIC